MPRPWAVAYNLRFPGQYFDSETGKHYNYFRDYDPSTGRYIESDPIGLLAGLNTYAYVKGSPINRRDLLGLVCGSGWSDRVIPDNPFGFGFAPCCQGHDDCYDDCGKHSPIKEDCDGRFYRCMTDKCKSLTGAVKWVCELSAAGYFTAVDRAGSGPYNRARDKK